jgi:hypothetical protein
MSSMPREVPSCGDSARDGARAGDLTREGSVVGEGPVGVLADKGLGCGISLYCHDVELGVTVYPCSDGAW